MKIVLRETVEHVGQAGEVVEVKRGYARNYLLPKKLAMTATPSNLKSVEMIRRRQEAKSAKLRSEAEVLAQKITAMTLELAHRAGDTETIYGAVTAAEIAFALEEKGVQVDHRRIQMEGPIKTLGVHTIPIRLHPDVIAHVTVSVVRDEV
ncbi:MAG: 50S ribosomal protein L9 [Acidobacteriota bacterium]